MVRGTFFGAIYFPSKIKTVGGINYIIRNVNFFKKYKLFIIIIIGLLTVTFMDKTDSKFVRQDI